VVPVLALVGLRAALPSASLRSRLSDSQSRVVLTPGRLSAAQTTG
jgi:hypothetical protein